MPDHLTIAKSALAASTGREISDISERTTPAGGDNPLLSLSSHPVTVADGDPAPHSASPAGESQGDLTGVARAIFADLLDEQLDIPW